MTETGYDLATLLRPAGEARRANVRKLSRLAAEYEEREGRDLRGLLDFLAARAEIDTEAQAATAAEGHDGVRIMTVHDAKGLEFEVVAVPDLARGLLAGGRRPVLALGREQPPRVGLQWRRLGRPAVNLYDYGELIEAGESRDSEEGLRLFHVAATRARERLILSGVVKPEPAKETKPGTPVVERLVDALGAPRPAKDDEAPDGGARRGSRAAARGRPERPAEADLRAVARRLADPGPRPSRARASRRPSPERDRGPPQPALARARRRTARPSPGRDRRPPARIRDAAAGRAQAAGRPQPPALLHRDLGLRGMRLPLLHGAGAGTALQRRQRQDGSAPRATRGRRRGRNGAPAAPPSTPCSSGARRTSGASPTPTWPAATRSRRGSTWSGRPRRARPGAPVRAPPRLLGPVRDWLGSPLREEIAAASRVRAEVPILLGAGGTVLRGSIDLLVERDGAPPLVVDYKTDRLRGEDPSDRASHYEVQRSIYAMAAAESLGASEVEVAYVFLERADAPVRTVLTAADMESARTRIASTVTAISAGNFSPAPEPDRTWDLCRGCPALGRLCCGPPG